MRTELVGTQHVHRKQDSGILCLFVDYVAGTVKSISIYSVSSPVLSTAASAVLGGAQGLLQKEVDTWEDEGFRVFHFMPFWVLPVRDLLWHMV